MNTIISTRISDDELKIINDKMNKLGIKNRSEYIRTMSVHGYIINESTENKIDDLNAMTELSIMFNNLQLEFTRIGTNLNQIAKKINSNQLDFNLENDLNSVTTSLMLLSNKTIILIDSKL